MLTDIVVFCIFKDALAVDAAHHDMINSCARLDAAFPCHDTILFGTLTCPLCPLKISIRDSSTIRHGKESFAELYWV